ncbi:predicted protein [Cyanophage PSS2]|uniref:hypothetical protein n=1 Tax=Cyanophage PSS2 TaxID=658401 RepID=UPI0001B04017|nr:hypothetical protein PSS2_gp065 [Cyanophage PSS2]ACT65627.1 hypothetical protein [Cyanophage PSS2]ACY75768.1 predicted protein [Cyanophage PSS2]
MVEGVKLERERFHALELPTAQLAALTANLNRDSKKNRKPFSAEDFCFFMDRDANKPEERAARAYMKLEELEELPDWAVFCATDFLHGEGKPFLSDPALRGDGFLLLAPVEIDEGFRGLLIAQYKVSGKKIQAAWEGSVYEVDVPEFNNFVTAQSEVDVNAIRLGTVDVVWPPTPEPS